MLVFGLVAYLSSEIKNKAISVIACVVPFVLLLFCSSVNQALGILPVMIYGFILCASEKFFMPYYYYKFVVLGEGVVFLILAVVAGNICPSAINTILFGSFFVLCAINSLKRIRIGKGLDKRGQLISSLEVVVVVVAVTIVMIGLYEILTHSSTIIEWILMPFAALLYLFTRIFVALGSFITNDNETDNTIVEDQEIIEDSDTIQSIGQEIRETTQNIVSGASNNVWKVVVLVLIIAIVIFVIYWITRNFSKDCFEDEEFESTESFSETTSRRQRNRKKKEKRKEASSNAEIVRSIYKDYLGIVKQLGVVLVNSDTSLKVNQKSQKLIDEEAAKGLRELYLKARYASQQEITDEDVALAQEYYSKLFVKAE